MTEIILASQSPYRKELLSRLKIPFKTHSPHLDEHSFYKPENTPLEIAKTLSFEKAKKVQSSYPEAIIIGSDQVLSFEKEIFGKPNDIQVAISQLKRMRGKNHRLITAVSVLYKNKIDSFHEITSLRLREDLLDREIIDYVKKDLPLDCAGSYKIEGLGISLFQEILTSDFTAIIGLPLIKLAGILRQYHFQIP